MKSKIQFLFFAASIFIFPASFSINAQEDGGDASNLYSEKIVTEDNLRSFYESFLNKDTIDSFNRFRCFNSESYTKIDVSEASLGMFTCGTNDIEYVTASLPVKFDLRIASVTEAIEKYEADFHEMKIQSAYDRYFPVTLFLQGKSQHPFRRVNVDAVTWLSNNIIPSPDTVINGVNAQTIYDTSLRNFFRSMKFYYDYLHNELDIEYELMLYKKMIVEEDSHWAGNWLDFWYNRKDYGTNVNPEVKPHQFMGFWLRRELDGSATALHSALLKILEVYDKKGSSTKNGTSVNYKIIQETLGDLNKDGIIDKVVALENKNDKSAPTKIVVLLQQQDSTFKEDTESFTIIPSGFDDVDTAPQIADISIKENELVIDTSGSGATGNTQSKFRYIDNKLRLTELNTFSAGAGGHSSLAIDLLRSKVELTETNTLDETMPSETTTTLVNFPEILFANADPYAVIKMATADSAGKPVTGILVSGGGIDNYSLGIKTDAGNIDAYCQPDCGDWFENSTEHEGVTLKNSLKNKKVSIVVATEANNGRLAGPSDDEEFLFLKKIEFIE